MAGTFARRPLAALAAFALITAMSGCTDDSDADADEGSSPSASSSASPTPSSTPSNPDPGPTEPVAPEGLAEPTKKGAELLVRYYWEVVDYAQKTGDVRKLKTLSRPGCEACNFGISGIRGIHKDGGFIHGGHHTIRSLKVTRFPTRETVGFRIDITLHSSKQEARASAGAKLDRVPQALDPMLIAVSKDSDGLLKIDLVQIQPVS